MKKRELIGSHAREITEAKSEPWNRREREKFELRRVRIGIRGAVIHKQLEDRERHGFVLVLSRDEH